LTWLENNNLNIHLDKTKYILFETKSSADINMNINYNNIKIENVNMTKFLGILMDIFCNWKAHIDVLVTKLDRYIYALNRIRQVASRDAAVIAYDGYMLSTLRYGIILWGNSTDMLRAFRLQKKCIRSICGAHYLNSCKPLFNDLNVLPLPCLYIHEICTFVKKQDCLFLKKESNGRSQRNGERLQIPQQRLALYSENCYCIAI
jgi:hypothetical protein